MSHKHGEGIPLPPQNLQQLGIDLISCPALSMSALYGVFYLKVTVLLAQLGTVLMLHMHNHMIARMGQCAGWGKSCVHNPLPHAMGQLGGWGGLIK